MFSSSSPAQIVFLDRATLSPQTVLKPFPFPHALRTFEGTTTDEVAARIGDADIVVTNKVRLDATALDRAPHLKMIAIAATGTDIVDLDACAARGIVVSNIRGYAVRTVPEHTFALIFALRRSLVAYRDAVRAGRWLDSGQFCFFDHPIRDLAGATLGIVGDGVLGRAVAGIARALGMRVLFAAHGAARGAGHVPLDTLLRDSDVITLHCPLTPATSGLIDAAAFARMARRPLLINTARGGLVDEGALVDALQSGQISGAGFDVVTQEPLPAAHPFHAILSHPAFILTPHVAWASDEAMRALADQLVDNVAAFARGEPRQVV
ncbi:MULTISPECIES: D-2-hydroxyacid dehydrogenase [unclassified Burkholderia]|uniref:D-2-hydroxyacid dehydrogenase n=1 Tax=unclassified Burkholderia TaxID=2613784 RepID=UPI000F58C498|nr:MULTISPECIES: D-2-hydroxyacid dehydrogenase [unclassified Burkholderia]RQR87514.1 D-2-hydroxyacid dehydrogenase [Burkholderia sp. Bp9011]RQR96864.1 D-2-hydroxyacid dehydrogenase [Burkholderia sp. Bp9010]RQS07462.1 D-2-hydroxyacid dehydrogenase [Burkholderia sp. Bp8991]RQS30768.1 D-2-hydroxyacid dehydrogenase [Burkholderia sp. Bp8995]RQS51561.1 D-2-hydroxyacid dehydrogenase [Burkholderia sp. Bp8989]